MQDLRHEGVLNYILMTYGFVWIPLLFSAVPNCYWQGIGRVAGSFSRSVPKDDLCVNKKVLFFQEKKENISSVQYRGMYIS